jgi:DNA-binding NarL/FixJ family response regulator
VIRVVIADDHAIVRTGLAQVLEGAEDIDLVGVAEDGEQAVRLAAERDADVVLMDLVMPTVGGAEATRRLLSERPGTQVVILTSFSDRERILDALDAGAIGYLLKDTEPDAVLDGVRAAARGESPLAPKAARALVSERAGQRPSFELSEREREVLALVGDGLSNKQVARRLEISEKTVKAHLTRIFRELGVFDRTQAALWAREHGLARRS